VRCKPAPYRAPAPAPRPGPPRRALPPDQAPAAALGPGRGRRPVTGLQPCCMRRPGAATHIAPLCAPQPWQQGPARAAGPHRLGRPGRRRHAQRAKHARERGVQVRHLRLQPAAGRLQRRRPAARGIRLLRPRADSLVVPSFWYSELKYSGVSAMRGCCLLRGGTAAPLSPPLPRLSAAYSRSGHRRSRHRHWQRKPCSAVVSAVRTVHEQGGPARRRERGRCQPRHRSRTWW